MGCEIVDIAPDRALNRKVSAFIRAELLDASPAFARVQERALAEAGLLDESAKTLVEMKATLAEYRRWVSEQKR